MWPERRAEVLHAPSLGADPRQQEDRVRHQLTEAAQVLRAGGARHGAHRGETAVAAALPALHDGPFRRDGYDGALYFDTFPDASGLDPVAECEANITTVRRLLAIADRLDGDNRFGEALGRQDAIATQAIVNEYLIGV